MSPKTILHLDDEADIRELIALLLTRKGYKVIGAESAQDASKLLDQGPPDLFICDFQLSESDGVEAIREVKRRYPEVPVILLTGMIDPRVASESFGALVTVCLQKTSALSRLADEVKALIG